MRELLPKQFLTLTSRTSLGTASGRCRHAPPTGAGNVAHAGVCTLEVSAGDLFLRSAMPCLAAIWSEESGAVIGEIDLMDTPIARGTESRAPIGRPGFRVCTAMLEASESVAPSAAISSGVHSGRVTVPGGLKCEDVRRQYG